MPMAADETMVHPVPDAAVAALVRVGAEPRLRQIADVLGCSIDDFFDADALAPDLAGAAELLRLWSVVTDEPGRAKLLARVREAASAP